MVKIFQKYSLLFIVLVLKDEEGGRELNKFLALKRGMLIR